MKTMQDIREGFFNNVAGETPEQIVVKYMKGIGEIQRPKVEVDGDTHRHHMSMTFPTNGEITFRIHDECKKTDETDVKIDALAGWDRCFQYLMKRMKPYDIKNGWDDAGYKAVKSYITALLDALKVGEAINYNNGGSYWARIYKKANDNYSYNKANGTGRSTITNLNFCKNLQDMVGHMFDDAWSYTSDVIELIKKI